MPKHIKRNEHNDLIVRCDVCLHTLYQRKQQSISIPITEQKKINVPITLKIVKNCYYVALHEGIPRMCEENIYDISELSHVVVIFTKS